MMTKELCCGSAAGITSQVVCHPIDTMRTRLQTGNFTGLRDCVFQTIKFEGMRGFYKGLSVPLLAQGVYKSVIFSVNEASKRCLVGKESQDAVTPWVIPVSGAIAGAANAAVVTPVELIRNRLQMQIGRTTGTTYRGPLDVVRKVVQRHGISGMYTGYVPTVMRDGPGMSAIFVSLCKANHAAGMALFFLAFHAVKKGILASGMVEEIKFHHVVLASCCSGISFWSWACKFLSLILF